MAHIRLNDVGLLFKPNTRVGIKDLISGKRPERDAQAVQALLDITLDLSDGDRLGIVGHNGAGKSTLLRLINGIYAPSAGTVSTEGSISSLFELATGFEMEASGLDNIVLRGLMLGIPPKVMRQKRDEIVEFSGLGHHIHRPVKYYSSGMFLRLAFSISTAIHPEILLLDEVVAAGDAGFVEKARKRLDDMMDNVKILVFVSHSMPQICNFCNLCAWMENGSIIKMGNPKEITEQYIEYIQSSIR